MNKTDKKSRKRFKLIRTLIVMTVLFLSTTAGLIHQFFEMPTIIGVDALCPFGGIESFFTLIFTGAMLQKVVLSSFILLIAVLLSALIFRRTFCGSFCAFGALQELFGTIGGKLFKKRPQVPGVIDKWARYLKYIILALVVVLSARFGFLVIRPYDPWPAYHHLFSNELLTEFLMGFIVLIISLAGSVVYERFFCKYLCPMGAFLGLINKLGWFRVERNDSTCTHCGACTKACPVSVKIEEVETVNSAECINCNLCVASCPEKDTLYIGRNKKSRLSPMLFLGLSAAIFAAVIIGTSISGDFAWIMRPLKQEVQKKGTFDPNMITGRMTFEEVSEVSGIPKERFIEKFGIDEEDFYKTIKAVAHGPKNYGFEGHEVRTFVIEELGRE